MKILFTSDVHGLISAIESYTYELSKEDYDCGVIAGDIIDDGVPDNEIEEYIAEGYLHPDDFLEQLPPADLSFEEYVVGAIDELYQEDSPFMKALHLKEEKVKRILSRANKPVFIIPGNHDLTKWEDSEHILNIHNKRITFDGVSFVGYRWTSLRRTEPEREADAEYLKTLVNKNTILVTHDAPYGALDEHIGSKYLKKLVDDKRPMYHLFGHTHSNYGIYDNFINGAYPRYRKFVSINIDNHIKEEVEDLFGERRG